MAQNTLYTILQNLFVGAAGGISAYWLAHRRFISQKAWELKYEVYAEIIDTLHKIEGYLGQFECAVCEQKECSNRPELNEALKEYHTYVSRLEQLQERILLLGATDAHTKLMTVYVMLSTFDPSCILAGDKLKDEEIQEILENLKLSRREASGRNGEFAFLARKDLGLGENFIQRWWQKQKARKHLKKIENDV